MTDQVQKSIFTLEHGSPKTVVIRSPSAEPGKVAITVTVAFATLIVSLSSAYSGSVDEIIAEFGVSTPVATLSSSLYGLGFAIGPLF